jgi:hypothetical protein
MTMQLTRTPATQELWTEALDISALKGHLEVVRMLLNKAPTQREGSEGHQQPQQHVVEPGDNSGQQQRPQQQQ